MTITYVSTEDRQLIGQKARLFAYEAFPPIRIDWVYTDIYHCSTPKAFLFIVMRLSHITYVRDDHRILLDKEKVDKYETLLEKFLRDNGFRIFTETEFTHRAFAYPHWDENKRD